MGIGPNPKYTTYFKIKNYVIKVILLNIKKSKQKIKNNVKQFR